MKRKSTPSMLRLSLVSIITGVIIAFSVILITPIQTLAEFDFQPPVDVRPTDYYYQALESLGRKYNCFLPYPDGTFRGNRALTRYELAANLNLCMQQVEEAILDAKSNPVTHDEVANLKNIINALQEQVNLLRNSPFIDSPPI